MALARKNKHIKQAWAVGIVEDGDIGADPLQQRFERAYYVLHWHVRGRRSLGQKPRQGIDKAAGLARLSRNHATPTSHMLHFLGLPGRGHVSLVFAG